MGTPIEQGMNLAELTGAELRSVGIDTLEKLRELGWEEAMVLWCQAFPERIHAMAAYALIGAELGVNCLQLSEEQKGRAKGLVRRLRREAGG